MDKKIKKRIFDYIRSQCIIHIYIYKLYKNDDLLLLLYEYYLKINVAFSFFLSFYFYRTIIIP